MADSATPAGSSPPTSVATWVALGLAGLALAGLAAHVITTQSHPKQFAEVDRRLRLLEEHEQAAPSADEWARLFVDLAGRGALSDDARYVLSWRMLSRRPAAAQYVAGMRGALHPSLVATILAQPHAPALAWLAATPSAAAPEPPGA